jgi:hypothetical protein
VRTSREACLTATAAAKHGPPRCFH